MLGRNGVGTLPQKVAVGKKRKKDLWPALKTQEKTGNDGEPSPSLILLCGGRHSEQPPRRDAINLISGLVGWFCGGAAVVGGSGAE